MTTDWKPARRLEELAERPQLPQYARDAMREGAEMIRFLDEELHVRSVLITALRRGELAPGAGWGPGRLAEIRRGYHQELQALRTGTEGP